MLNAVDALDVAPDVAAGPADGDRDPAQDDARLGPASAARNASPAAARRGGRRARAAAPPSQARRRAGRSGRSACALPFLCCAVFCWLLGTLGIIGAAPSAPVPDGALPFDMSRDRRRPGGSRSRSRCPGCCWGSLVRRRGITEPFRPDGESAGCRRCCCCSLLACVVWLGNPYTALLLVLALHAWLLIAAPELRPRRSIALGLVAARARPARAADRLLCASARLRPRPYGLGGRATGRGRACRLRFGACSGASLSGARPRCDARRGPHAQEPALAEPDERVEITIRGPLSYAGPGSLGGTESALRR